MTINILLWLNQLLKIIQNTFFFFVKVCVSLYQTHVSNFFLNFFNDIASKITWKENYRWMNDRINCFFFLVLFEFKFVEGFCSCRYKIFLFILYNFYCFLIFRLMCSKNRETKKKSSIRRRRRKRKKRLNNSSVSKYSMISKYQYV